MRFTASAFLGLALLLWGGGAWGQQTGGQTPPPPKTNPSAEMTQDEMTQKEKDAWEYFYLEEVLQRSCDDPTLRSAIALPQPKLTLETSAEGSTMVKASVGVEVQKKYVFSLDVTSPINSSGETTLADLNGLSTGSSATLHFSRFWMPWSNGSYSKALAEIQKKTTDVLDKVKIVIDKSETAEAALAEIEKLTADSEDDKTSLEQIKTLAAESKPAEERIAEIHKIVDENWHLTDYLNPVISRPSAVAMFGKKKRDEIMAIWQDKMDHTVWVSTLDVNAEQKEFQTGNSQPGVAKESHTNFKLTASGGAYFKGNYASLNYRRGTEFKAAQTDGPPKSQTAEALEFEIRRFFGTFGGGAHLTRDLQANVTTVEIPFYFLRNMGSTDMELNGGVAVRWQSDTKKVAIIAFIGPALSKVLRMGNGTGSSSTQK